MLNRYALTALRQANHLSISALATRAGLSLQYVSDLEHGRRKGMSPDTVRALADALDVKFEAIWIPPREAAA